MEYQNYIYNSSVVLNSEGTCTINCPGCSFAAQERLEINLLSIDDLKIRIDFAAKNLDNNSSLCQALEKLDTLYYTKNQLLLAVVKMLENHKKYQLTMIL